jgi:hypothetical protein
MTESEAAREKGMIQTLISIIDMLRTPMVSTGMLEAGAEALETSFSSPESRREIARTVWIAMTARLPGNLQEQP